MRAIIPIVGPIGSFSFEGEQINGVLLKDIVSAVTSLNPAIIDEIQFDMNSPGGVKTEGDNIYNYIKSIQPRFKVIMNQIGDIGSIATKIWFAAPERVGLIGTNPETGNPFEFFIHNPWRVVKGDANAIAAAYRAIKPEEDELKAFYIEQTGITNEGLTPLLDEETGFPADQAVAMKFATSTRMALNIAAYMDKNEKTVGQRIDSLVAVVEKLLAIHKNPTVALVLELENGTKISADTQDPTKLENVTVVQVDPTGVPTATAVVDGSVKLKDGRTLTVVGGKITKVDAAVAAAPTGTPPVVTPAVVADPATVTALKKLEDLVEGILNKDKAKSEEEILAAKIQAGVEAALAKKKTTHTPETIVINGKAEIKETPIQGMQRLQRERKAKKLEQDLN